MVVGVLTVDMHFAECTSLKEKRTHLNRLRDRLRQRFNLSVGEVAYQDLWQRTRLGLAHVNTSAREAETVLHRALELIDAYHGGDVLEHELTWS